VEALKCGVEGPFFDAEQVVRRLLDALYECVAVQGSFSTRRSTIISRAPGNRSRGSSFGI